MVLQITPAIGMSITLGARMDVSLHCVTIDTDLLWDPHICGESSAECGAAGQLSCAGGPHTAPGPSDAGLQASESRGSDPRAVGRTQNQLLGSAELLGGGATCLLAFCLLLRGSFGFCPC